MAVNDIYLSRLHFENPTGVASSGLYFRETSPDTNPDNECQSLADGLHANIVAEVRAVLSDDWFFAGITVEKVFGDPRPQYERTGKDALGLAAGTEGGPGLPANQSIQLDLLQVLFTARQHGKMFIPGIPEAQSNGNTLKTAYQNGAVSNLAAALKLQVNAPSDTGVWAPGVISAKIRDAALPAKDWANAFAPLIDITINGIIARQRRRTTRARGISSIA